MRACVFLLLALSLAVAQAQEEKDKVSYDNLIPALGALERGDYAQAVDTLRPLAADGNVEAQYVLGTVLETAPPPLRDFEAAHGWYLRAAESGNAAAQNNLGAMYYDGRGTLRNFIEA